MPLKLNSSGGGSVTVQEPSTASNRTLTLPDADGTVIYSDASANLQFNSGYGSIATAYGCRAWVNFNGTGTVAIRASGNVSSITDNGTGDYTLNFTTSMPDANYSASGVVGVSPGATAGFTGVFDSSAAPTTSALRVYSVSAANALTDYTRVFYAVFR